MEQALTETSLAAFQDSSVHSFIRMQGHFPGVFSDDEIPERWTFHEDIIRPAHTLAHSEDVQIIPEEVEVDVWVSKRIGAIQGDLSTGGNRAQQVDYNSHEASVFGDGVMPLKSGAEHGDKVELEMRLAARAEGVKTAIRGLCLAVVVVLIQAVVDAGESDQFEQARCRRTGLVTAVGGHGCVVGGSGAEKVVVECDSVFEAQRKGYNGVVEQVLSDMRRVNQGSDSVLEKFPCWANPAEHQELGRLEHALGKDNLSSGEEVEVSACRTMDDLDTDASMCRGVNDETLGLGRRQDRHIGLVGQVEVASLAFALVDRVHAVSQTMHLTREDILGQGFIAINPGLGQSISEGLQLGDKFSVRDLDRTAGADLPQSGRVEVPVIVVGRTLPQIVHAVVPRPSRAAVFLPVVECRRRPGNPGKVVGAGTAAENFATGIGLLDSFIVVALDHGGLVGPVMLATAQAERLGWSRDVFELVWIPDPGFDDQDFDVWVLGEAASDSISSCASTNDDEVVLGSIGNYHGAGQKAM